MSEISHLPHPSIALEEAAAAFLGERNLAASSRRVYRLALEGLSRDLGTDVEVATITQGDLASYLRRHHADAAPKTWNRMVATFGSFFAYCARQGWVAASPAHARPGDTGACAAFANAFACGSVHRLLLPLRFGGLARAHPRRLAGVDRHHQCHRRKGAVLVSVSTIVVALNAQLLRRVDIRPTPIQEPARRPGQSPSADRNCPFAHDARCAPS